MHITKKIFVPLTEIQRNQEWKEELTYWDAKNTYRWDCP